MVVLWFDGISLCLPCFQNEFFNVVHLLVKILIFVVDETRQKFFHFITFYLKHAHLIPIEIHDLDKFILVVLKILNDHINLTFNVVSEEFHLLNVFLEVSLLNISHLRMLLSLLNQIIHVILPHLLDGFNELSVEALCEIDLSGVVLIDVGELANEIGMFFFGCVESIHK